MTRLLCSIFVFTTLVMSAAAEERKLNGKEIMAVLADKTFQQVKPETKRKTTQIFQKAGVTHFIVENAVSTGLWRVENNAYCSNWPPSQAWDCYDILQDDKAIIFLSASGARYVMVPETP